MTMGRRYVSVSYLYCFCPIEYTGIMHTNIPLQGIGHNYVCGPIVHKLCNICKIYKSSSVFTVRMCAPYALYYYNDN